MSVFIRLLAGICFIDEGLLGFNREKEKMSKS